MAKEFTLILGGVPFSAAPVKLERKKLYGWSDLVATDRDGHICTAAYISPEDSLMIPSGAAKMATVDERGLIVKKSDLIAFDADGKELEIFPSSFDSPIDLSKTATEEEFLDHEWSSVYQIHGPPSIRSRTRNSPELSGIRYTHSPSATAEGPTFRKVS